MVREQLVSPQWMAMVDGYWAHRFSVEDVYFEDEAEQEQLKALEDMLDALSDDEKACVELRFVATMSYRDVAKWMGWWTAAGDPDGKKAWRICRRGLKRLREKMEGSGK